MEAIELSDNEIKYLNTQFPSLNYEKGKNVINGILSFNLKFEDNGETLIDEYQIEIDLSQVSNLGLPIIRETGGRIINIAKTRNVRPQDLHLNSSNGEMCIIIPPKIKEKYPNGFNLEVLLNHLQEHLYWVSYFEKHGKAPWKEYGHGDLGYLELYLESKEKYTTEFKNHFGCNSRSELRRKVKELRNKYKI